MCVYEFEVQPTSQVFPTSLAFSEPGPRRTWVDGINTIARKSSSSRLWLTVLGEAALTSTSSVVTLGVVPEPLRDPADEADEASAVVSSDKAGREEEGD